MAKMVAIKKVVCSVLIFLIVMSVIPVSVCGIPDQTLIQTFTPAAGTVAGSTGPASEATSTTSLPYESIQSDGYGHYIKFMLYGPEEVVKDEIETYVVRIESVDSDGNPVQRIIMNGNVYTCYKDDAVETYPVSIKERWNERWYDIDPEQDWDEDSIMNAMCGDLMSLAIPIPGLGTLLALFTENPPKPSWSVFYDKNTYDTIQIPFTPPTKWDSRYVPLVGEQPHPNAVELWIPYKFTSEGTHQIYFFMWAQGMAPSSPVNTSDFYITVEATTVTPQPISRTTNSIGMEFVRIPAGEFDMGSPSDEEGRYSNEGPVHHVTIDNPFYMGKYEVTQQQWRAIMGDNPSYFTGYDDLPVEEVSWDDVQDFITKLNDKEGTTKYRLPAEAEWEYACRAGTSTRYSFGDDDSELSDYAWYFSNSGWQTHPVGQKKANPWGLYDMHGNVWEWVQDCWHSDYNGAPADGSAWVVACRYDGADRVGRGGSWVSSAGDCRFAYRGYGDRGDPDSDLGFRLVGSTLRTGDPILCTSPDPLGHDFGTIPEDQIGSWNFDIMNCGSGTLTWTVSCDQPWIKVNPSSGSTTTKADRATITIDASGFAAGTHIGHINVTTNDGNKTGMLKVDIPGPVKNLNTGKSFSTIQASIEDNDTLDGHLITVAPGTYIENIEVTKSLMIRSTSENPQDTIIQAKESGCVISVYADSVEIRGFTTKGATYFGIHLSNANFCNITNNEAHSNTHPGIYLSSSSSNIISGNIVSNNGGGISIQGNSNNNIIDNNIANSNGCHGIDLKFSSNGNTITGNTAKSNYHSGIQLSSSSSNTIIGNTVSNNDFGISITDSSLNNKVFLNNLIEDHGTNGDPSNIWNSIEEMTYTYEGNTYKCYLGNYWGDYEKNYPSAKEIDHTGIWNTPYEIPWKGYSKDNYPLKEPSENYLVKW